MKASHFYTLALLVAAAMLASGCGKTAQGESSSGVSAAKSAARSPASVQGHSYESNGGVVRIDFRSGGKAYFNAGPVSKACTYSQTGNKVIVNVERDRVVFTVDDEDGALLGPGDGNGMLSRLTLKR